VQADKIRACRNALSGLIARRDGAAHLTHSPLLSDH
jgi:hypothetical protein